MDGSRFDTLIKRLATTSLSRSTALRGLAASIAAFAGVTRAAEPSAADELKVCHCKDEFSTSCETKKNLERRSVKRHLRRHRCDYRGECKGVSGCCLEIGETCTSRLTCCSGNCLGGQCQPCKSIGTSCGFDSECCSRNCNVSCQA